MNLTTKDLLQHSFVITIDDERFKWFKKVFKFHSIEPLPRRFPGVTLWYNSPQYNCYLSHKNAILKAKKLKWPYVCIFEDDAYPINNVMDKLNDRLKELPETCKVFVLGHIMLWDIRGEDGNFYRSFKSYGGHAYVVFKDAYDKFIEMLDKAPEGDGAFYSRMDDILPKDSFYIPKDNLFIQYTKSNGMNNNGGYVFIDSRRLITANGMMYVPYDKTISVEQAIRLGFPMVEDIENGDKKMPHTFNVSKGFNSAIPFVTVNAGTNTFTNITLKTIFKHHPNAKAFVIDVSRNDEGRFHQIDEMSGVEVIQGVMWDDLNLPVINIPDSRNITDEERMTVMNMFGSDKIDVLPCGDYQHPINIQFAIDTIGVDGFILVDSDAPLISPVNTLVDGNVVTSAKIEYWNYIHLDRLRPLLRPELSRTRFSPYIQYLNTKMMRNSGIKYFDPGVLKDNLWQAGWFKNPCYGGRESVFFWTGSLFYSKVVEMKLPFKPLLSTSMYVDHFGGATWQEKSEHHKRFIEKYIGLFKNQDGLRGKVS